MTVTSINGWRLPGCSDLCSPRSHDPISHEQFGYARALVESPYRVVVTGRLEVDLTAQTALVDGVEVACAPKVWAVLAYLAERVGRWTPNREIVREVWGPEWVDRAPYRGGYERRDTVLLRRTIERLRQKLGPAGTLVTTRPGSKRLLLEVAR